MLEYLTVGIVLKPQGIKGEIKVKPLTDDMERFDDLKKVYIKPNQEYKPINITGRRYDKGFVFLSLEDHRTIESVEPLRNQYLWIPRSMSVKLPKDSYLIADIIGCDVIDTKGRELGKIFDVMQTGSNDVYQIKGSMGQILIPALKKVVVDVNLKDKRITVDLTDMEGLLPDEI